MPFNFRENTSSGKQREMPQVRSIQKVGKILGSGEPGNVHGFRPGGATGYNTVGGRSGMQVKIPSYRDQSKVK